MLLQPPNLDDRTWDQLVTEQLARVRELCPTWTDLSPGDPGRVLLELYAYLTETMIYRLNRLPDKAFVEFLRLIDVRLHPPIAAGVTLRFSRARPDPQPLAIPRGTRVTLNRSDGGGTPPVFTTDQAAEIPAGQAQVDVAAHHCDLIQGELAGTGTGLPGLSVVARRPPIVAPVGADGDLVVGVEAKPGELGDRVPQITFDGKIFRVWTEADNFADSGPDDPVYVADRVSGTVTFAPAVRKSQDGIVATTNGDTLTAVPAALGAVPAAGREIRLWYRRGGGPDGNVAANLLIVLKDQIAGVQVTNPAPATGGQAAEDLANAMVRGPQELHSLKRAVTKHDFEQIAVSQGVARAYAFTRAAFWKHAAPGTVEVLLVPQISAAEIGGGAVTVAMLEQHQTEPVRAQVAAVLDERRPLGTNCVVSWTRYKTVRVSAQINVFRQEDADAVKRRVLAALNQTINPLPTTMNPDGWGFGQALHVSNVYDVALEPGVHWVDQVKLHVDDVPDKAVLAIAADLHQPHTWHAGSGSALFRSLNDGDGWERSGSFPEGQVSAICPHPNRPGWLGLVVQIADGSGSRLYTSVDCAETWTFVSQTNFVIQDIDWLERNGQPILLLASDHGLFEQAPEPGKGPLQVAVDPQQPNLGFYAVAVSGPVRGVVSVALAAQNEGGVYLSKDVGRSYVNTGLQNHDVRRLGIQYSGVQAFLWAGTFAAGEGATGEGCFRWELLGADNPQDGWQTWGNGWQGGSCRAITFAGTTVLCGSHHAGVLRIDTSAPHPQWQASDLKTANLPLRSQGNQQQFLFQPVETIAADPKGQLVMVGEQEGIFRSPTKPNEGIGVIFEKSSRSEFTDQVTLPETWLFCSGEHDIKVQ